MPCFKGLAVSIHTPDGPLPEHSVQRQSRLSRINAYIPVPPAKIPEGSTTNRPEQSTFAISITLLTPGQNVPYSTPKASDDDPHPAPKLVGGIPSHGGDRSKNVGAIGPYIPLTTSPNETIAAYIYFDGRAKEEVATLLRRGEETWVNSRWVGIPESEGGGLAEREFLFREVGLERWLNGLDLEGKDAAAKIERRRQKMEKRRRKRKEANKGSDDENGIMEISPRKPAEARGVLRYGADERSPLEKLSDDDDLLSSDSDSDDDDPIPETAGQIKVALFRVLASGEIKRGEYSPQFDAHDDDDDSQNGHGENGHANGSGGDDDGDADHTTSFAKPKSLDPKSISTQTVTGIDPTDKPYAIFTFMYRGERQLQKMGIIHPPKTQEKTAPASKRRSMQTDFSSLGPLKPGGTVGFSGFRDSTRPRFDPSKGVKKSKDSDMDSEEDDDDQVAGKIEDLDGKDDDGNFLSPVDAERQGELAEGVRKIKLKRQHSAEPLTATTGTPEPRKTSKSNTPTAGTSPPYLSSTPPPPLPSSTKLDTDLDRDRFAEESIVGSPLKKQRASLAGLDDEMMRRRLGLGFGGTLGEILGSGTTPGGNVGPESGNAGGLGKAFAFGESTGKGEMKVEDDEEL